MGTTEPVAVGAAVVTLVQAVLVLVVAFGVDLTPEQTAAIMAVVTSLVTLAAAIVVRRKVSPLR